MIGDNDPMLTEGVIQQGVDCTDSITQLQTSMAGQQHQINSLEASVNKLVDMLTPLHQQHQHIAAQRAGDNVLSATGGLTSAALSTVERPNVCINNATPPDLTVGQQSGPNDFMSPPKQSQVHEDALSLQGSNIWFKSIINTQNDEVLSAASLSGHSSRLDKNERVVKEIDQTYWDETAKEYENTSQAAGPEITSSIAGAAKIFWQKCLKEDVLKKKLECAALPSNCPCLVPKKTNPEVWAKMGNFNRTVDYKLQEAQNIHSASVTMLLRAASSLTEIYRNKSMPTEIKEVMDNLKESMSLAGRASQQINQTRRELIKPSLPTEYKKLASEVEETSDLLFGPSLCEKMEKLKKENHLCSLLDKDRSFQKRRQNSSNSGPSQKSQRRAPSNGSHNHSSHHHNQSSHQNHQKQHFRNKENKPNNQQKKSNFRKN